MQKFEYEGEVYHLVKGRFVDENYFELPTGMQASVEKAFYNSIDYKALKDEELLCLIRDIKKCEKYDLCVIMCEYGLEKYKTNHNFVKRLLSTYTSCLRELKQSKQAIALGESFLQYKEYQSACLYNSLAAAYCDMYNGVNTFVLDIAEDYANKSTAIRGKAKYEELELRRVKQRISRLKDNFFI